LLEALGQNLALRLASESDKSLAEVPANFLLRSLMIKVGFIDSLGVCFISTRGLEAALRASFSRKL
jgi:hypothetical protein